MRITTPFLLIAALAQAPVPSQPPRPAPQPQVTFKVDVSYVEINASVTDAQGGFVRNLTRDDFQVIEDGKPQALTAFSMVDIPIERPDPPLFATAAIPPDVATNRRPFEGRVFVLVIDDLHTRFSRSARARAGARQFVERYVGANDIVAVVNTSGFGKGMQDFTSNRALALRAIDAAMGIKTESSTQAALADYQMNQGMMGGAQSNANAAFNEMQRYNNARNALRTLRNVADYMAGMRGRRKAVVYFSEGINYDVTNAIANRYAADTQREIQEMIAAATRANVHVYSVDPRGVTSGMEDVIELAGFPADGSISSTQLMNEMRLEHDSLRVVAEETGGFAVLNQNDFRGGFGRILADNSSYYVLGYYPTNDKRDGRFRNVDVKVLKPGLRVRARRGYVAPTAKKAAATEAPARTSPELRDALDSPVAIGGLTITAFAAPFKGAGSNDALAVAVEIEGSTIPFTQTAAGMFANDLEITLFAASADGRIKDGVRDVVNLALRPQTYETVRQGGFRVVRRLQVPPGKYQVRVGARESGGRLGTVLLDVEAPDFTKPGLSMSGIAIASAFANRMPTANPDPSVNEFKDVLPSAPTALREFPRGDQLSIFAEVYDNGAKAPHRVEIKTEVLADDGTVVQTKADERKSEELQGASGGYGHTTQIPLTALAPGRYVLRVTARSFLGNTAPVSRAVEFRVR